MTSDPRRPGWRSERAPLPGPGASDGHDPDEIAEGGIVLTGLHARMLDQMGLEIASGTLPAESALRIEELEERYGVSRSVVREAVRVLASMGMVVSRRRIGIQILPAERWNLFDPQVIHWRLASPGRVAQLRSISELRSAVEPEAARLAALRAPLAGAGELMGLAGKIWAVGQDDDPAEYLRLDIEFHRLVLECSGNEMFAQLDRLVTEVLIGRMQYGLMPSRPHPEALQLHIDLASAIQRGDPDGAHGAMVRIMDRVVQEMSAIWERQSTESGNGDGGRGPSHQE